MAISFELPPELEQHLRQDMTNLDAVAKEAALVELYRQERISRRELAEGLGLNRLEVDEVLKRHRVTEDLATDEEVQEDLLSLRKILSVDATLSF